MARQFSRLTTPPKNTKNHRIITGEEGNTHNILEGLLVMKGKMKDEWMG